jgi:nicotinamidase-related amidase
MSNRKALILIDFINDIVDPSGKLAGKGYAKFDQENGALARANTLLNTMRQQNALIIHAGVGFSPGYPEQPKQSPLFGKAHEYGALQLGQWGTQFHGAVKPLSSELCIIKHRVSAFFSTSLDAILRNQNIDQVVIAGCATDMAVQSTARDAHDRDYRVTIVADCCIAANADDHDQTLRMLGKIATIKNLDELYQANAA